MKPYLVSIKLPEGRCARKYSGPAESKHHAISQVYAQWCHIQPALSQYTVG